MSVQGTMFNPYMNYMNPYMNSYNSYAAMGDIYGFDDFNYSSYMGTPMSFCGGYNCGFGGIDYTQYYNNMSQMQDFYSQYAIHNAELQRKNDILINSPDAGINRTLQVLQEKITSSEQEQIIGALEAFKEAVRQKYPYADEVQIRNFVAEEYSRRTETSLTEDIKKHGSSSFWQGFKQSITLGIFADNKTAAENISEITGQPVSRTDKTTKILGNVLGGVTLGTAAGSFIPVIGPLAGAIGGGLYGLAKGIFGF